MKFMQLLLLDLLLVQLQIEVIGAKVLDPLLVCQVLHPLVLEEREICICTKVVVNILLFADICYILCTTVCGIWEFSHVHYHC